MNQIFFSFFLINLLHQTDRYLIITNNNWKQKYSKNVKFNLLIIVSTITFVALINLPVSFLNGKLHNLTDAVSNSNNNFKQSSLSNIKPVSKRYALVSQADDQIQYSYSTFTAGSIVTGSKTTNTAIPLVVKKRVECYSTGYILYYQKLSFLIECLIPLLLMILFNYLLIKRTYKSSTKFALSSNNNHSNNNNNSSGILAQQPVQTGNLNINQNTDRRNSISNVTSNSNSHLNHTPRPDTSDKILEPCEHFFYKYIVLKLF